MQLKYVDFPKYNKKINSLINNKQKFEQMCHQRRCNKHLRRCSALLATEDIEIKTTVRF